MGDDIALFLIAMYQKFFGILGAISMAFLARIMAHAEYARNNNEPFVSSRLFFETTAAGFCGVIALGVGEYFLLGPLAVNALSGVFGYLGPKVLVTLITSAFPRKQ